MQLLKVRYDADMHTYLYVRVLHVQKRAYYVYDGEIAQLKQGHAICEMRVLSYLIEDVKLIYLTYRVG
jgi:hypothetical protein